MKINKFRIIYCLSFLMLYFLCFTAQAQNTITGRFTSLAGQQVRLVGFDAFGVSGIDSTKVSEQGVFKLKYANKDRGMGYLSAADNKAYPVVLDNEDIELKGVALSRPQSVVIESGKENKLFMQYAFEHYKREQALGAWGYLQKIYQSDSFFEEQKNAHQSIQTEMQRMKKEDDDFLKSLDADTYIAWYLSVRNLISSVSSVVQHRAHEIPATLAALRQLDYTDQRFVKSGLLKDAIESHFGLLGNMRLAQDRVYKEMTISIDLLIENLSGNEAMFNEVSQYLFNLLERQSLSQVSEYLSTKLLTRNGCMVNDKLAKKLELYRAMKKGNTAPDFVFSGDVLQAGSGIETPSRLSDIQSDYTVVVFGASWCPQCGAELKELLPIYEKWKLKGVEVVFVSLDTDEALFKGFSSEFPFISMCDYQKWNSPAVKDYYVFATPTLFVLDYNQKIILRPNFIKQIDAWVDHSLKN